MTEYSYRQRSKARAYQRRRRQVIISMVLISILVVAGITALVVHLISKDKNDDSKAPADNPVVNEEQSLIEDGVFIDSIAVGGMDHALATTAVDEYVTKQGNIPITLDVNGNMVTTTLAGIGFVWDVEAGVSAAMVMEEAGTVNLSYDINQDALDAFLNDECKQYTVKPKNAKLTRSNGEFIIKRGRVGIVIDNEATKEAIVAAVSAQISTGTTVNAAAVMVEKNPKYTSEDMVRCKDELGKFSTTFQESQIERSANLRNAVQFIDGTVLYPEDTFSVADAIYPLSADNGYKEAPSYADGQVVESLGGGVCQVSTTLYNAVLKSELEIVERLPHSMVVSYVEPSMDAAIAGDYKDLKFKNNTDTPIYIQGAVSSGVVTFTVYGHETRPSSRTIEFESVILETIEPGKDVVTKDPTKPKGYEKVTQSAHVGYVANLYKIIYENGAEVAREKINYSKYNAEPKYVTKGTKKVKDKKKDKDKVEKTEPPIEENENEVATEVPVVPLPPVEVTPEPPVATESVQPPTEQATEAPVVSDGAV